MALTGCMAMPVAAQSYPVKPIRIIAPFPAGGSSDTIARVISMKLNEAWGQPVVGNTSPVAININIFRKIGYDPQRDFTPVSLAVTGPRIVVVHPSVPAKNMRELITFARGRTSNARLNFGSSGPGSIAQLAAELFKGMTHVDMVHIPYKGSALITN